MRPDDTVCFCYHVSLRKIVNYVRRERPPVASLISECLSAGTGCGWCVPILRKLHHDVIAGDEHTLDELDATGYEQLRGEWIDQDKPDRDLDTYSGDILDRAGHKDDHE
jgi:NAD(P)H-nitrite reductase large subunit